MNRTIRHVSLLRWTIVAMHTALVVSASLCPVASAASKSELAWNRGIEALLMAADFSVTILTIPLFALRVPLFSPHGFLVSAMYVVVGGLQWYLLATLVARWTCGLQKAMPVGSKLFVVGFVAGILLVIGSGLLPWAGHFKESSHARSNRPNLQAVVRGCCHA
jgi:hypothetical protein